MSSLKREATEIIEQPDPKRARVGLQNRTSSFADILKTMEKEHPDWTRPEPKVNFDEALIFQQISIEEGVDGELLVYGVTEEGNSVAARVKGFQPYFYIKKEEAHTAEEISKLKGYINTDTNREVEVLLSERCELDGYHTSATINAIRISAKNTDSLRDVLDTSCVSSLLRNLLLTLLYLHPHWIQDINGTYETKFGSPTLYDASIPSTLQFMAERDITGMGWVEIAAGYELVSGASQKTHCQLEVSADLLSICGVPFHDDLVEYAPLRLLSFDIETRIPAEGFPEAEDYPVIQIGNMMMYQGEDTPSVRAIFTVDSCAPIEGASVFSFETEKEMLEAWRRFVIDIDPDILIGHNIWRFDLPYLFTRASITGAEDFAFLGRRKDDKAVPRPVKLKVGVALIVDTKDIVFSGRVQLDTYAFFLKERSDLKKKSLGFLGSSLLGPDYDKEDIQISEINDLQDGDENTRRRIAVYCFKDVYLPLQILNRVSGLENYIEACRVTGVPFSYLQRHGEDIRAKSIIARNALQMDYIIPEHNYNKRVTRVGDALDWAMPDVPITSEISNKTRAEIDHVKDNNICFLTHVSKLQIVDDKLRNGVDFITVSINGTVVNIVTPSLIKSMISQILRSLLSRQQAIKNFPNKPRYLALMTAQASLAVYTKRALRDIILTARPPSLSVPA